MKKNRPHFINGKWVQGKGKVFASFDPSTECIVWEGSEASSQEVNAAVDSAKSALEKWSELTVKKRIKFLEAFKGALAKNKESLSTAISQETGKPLWDSKGEVDAMINKVAISIDAYAARCPELSKQLPHGMSITRHRPHGLMAVLGPFNFPGHLPNGHIIPALLAGNTVVFKPSELTPYVAELTIRCWQEAQLPSGVINLVQGAHETGKLLSAHPDIDGLLFTGSWITGQRFAEQFSIYPHKILALEMGGNNPLVIGTISDFKAAAYMTVQSAFLSSGQRCTCARRLIVPIGKKGDAFLKELLKMIKSIRVGAYNDKPEPFMGPVVSIAAADALVEKQQELFDLGARPLLTMSRLSRGASFLTPGLIDVTRIENKPDGEIFGPLLQVVRVKNFRSAIEEANNTKYGLAAGILSDKKEEYLEFYRGVRAGIVNWNAQLTGASSAAPFGGVRKSGNNRPSAFYAADYCAYPVASIEAGALAMPKTFTPGLGI